MFHVEHYDVIVIGAGHAGIEAANISEKYGLKTALITKNYSELRPDHKTPINNLWLASMAQIYPEDRGTNYAIRDGEKVAELILKEN